MRLIELGLFRVGGEAYAGDNGSYGLATLRKGHVPARGGELRFDYPGKSASGASSPSATRGWRRWCGRPSVGAGGGPELLAYKDGRGRWVDVRSSDINEYLQEALEPG